MQRSPKRKDRETAEKTKESTLTSGDNDQKTQKYILYYKLYASDARK